MLLNHYSKDTILCFAIRASKSAAVRIAYNMVNLHDISYVLIGFCLLLLPVNAMRRYVLDQAPRHSHLVKRRDRLPRWVSNKSAIPVTPVHGHSAARNWLPPSTSLSCTHLTLVHPPCSRAVTSQYLAHK
jgi:hypothetical protein